MASDVGTDVVKAAALLETGGVVGYPTDTLYALGVRIDRPAAIRRLYAIKARPEGEPFTVAVARPEDLAPWGRLTPLARRMARGLPGPLTLVLERTAAVPRVVAQGATVGLRVPDEETALRLLTITGPLTATSANLHGAPPAADAQEAASALGDRVDYYLAGRTRPRGVASTIVDCRGQAPIVLREGALSASEVRTLAAH